MTETVTRSKPARHGKALRDRVVIVTNKGNSKETYCGQYRDCYGGYFAIDTDSGMLEGECKDWTVEELITTEE